MEIKIRLFAALKEIAGTNELLLEVPANISCGEVLLHLKNKIPALFSILESCLIAVNGVYTNSELSIGSGDEVAILPPVSGG